MRNVRIVLGKEWRDILADRALVFSLLLIPAVFTGMPLAFFYILRNIPLVGSPRGLESLMQNPAFYGLAPERIVQMVSINQFLTMFLILPLVIPSVLAAHSIVGEKTGYTLEPLLATPISVRELLLGKILAAAIPSVLLTWASYGVFLLGARPLIRDDVVYAHAHSAIWLGGMGLVAPLATFLSIGMTLLVSARAEDPRVAQQLSGLLVFMPVAALMLQTAGRMYLDEDLFLRVALALVVLDAAVLLLGAYFFRRETILAG